MTTRFSIWKSQIILHWDGKLPPGADTSTLTSSFKDEFLRKTKLPSGAMKLEPIEEAPGFETPLLKKLKDPNAVLPLLPQLEGHARWNERCQGFFLTFGKQNLQRIRQQFGADVMVDKGYWRVEELKVNLKRFNAAIETAIRIVNDKNLPPVPAKLPPIAYYQNQGVIYLVEVPVAPLFADCGVGKTYMVLVSTAIQIANGILTPGKTLICAKLATLETGWLADAAKFTDLKVVNLWIPDNYKRKEKILARLEEPADVYLINHDGVRVFEKQLAAKKFDKVVIDESTILRGYRGERSKGGAFGKAVAAVAEHAKWRVIMSGTPAANGSEDLWGQYKFLDPHGFMLEPSFFDFRKRWMVEKVFGKPDDEQAPRTWIMPRESDREIGEIIRPSAFRVRMRDHIKDMPAITAMKRTATMGKIQGQHYKEMLDSFSTTIDQEFVSVTIKLAQIQKLRQLTGGFVIDELKAVHELPDCPKWEMLDSLVEEEIARDEKVVIFAQHRWEIEKISTRYKDHKVLTVYGDNDSKENVANIKAFIEDPTIRIIVLQPKSAAHGITFTCAHYMIFFSVSYSAEEDYQCVKRIERAGQKSAMFVYYLLLKETIDVEIYDVVQAKHASQADLIDGGVTDDQVVEEIWQRLRGKLNIKRRGRTTHGSTGKATSL